MKGIAAWMLVVVLLLVGCASSPVATPEGNATGSSEAGEDGAMTEASPVAEDGGDMAESDPPEGTTTDGGRTAEFPNPLVVYRREGGVMGAMDEWTIYRTGRIVAGDGSETMVPAEAVAPLYALVDAGALVELDETYGAKAECRDCLVHTITLFGGESPKSVSITESGAELPPTVQALLATLVAVTGTPPQ